MTAISNEVFKDLLESLYVYLVTQQWDMSTISDHMSLLNDFEPQEITDAIARKQSEDLE